MARSDGPFAAAAAQAAGPCPSCGGSGVLRTDRSGHRTCLDCVGQGVLPAPQASALRAPDPQRLDFWRQTKKVAVATTTSSGAAVSSSSATAVQSVYIAVKHASADHHHR